MWRLLVKPSKLVELMSMDVKNWVVTNPRDEEYFSRDVKDGHSFRGDTLEYMAEIDWYNLLWEF